MDPIVHFLSFFARNDMVGRRLSTPGTWLIGDPLTQFFNMLLTVPLSAAATDGSNKDPEPFGDTIPISFSEICQDTWPMQFDLEFDPLKTVVWTSIFFLILGGGQQYKYYIAQAIGGFYTDFKQQMLVLRFVISTSMAIRGTTGVAIMILPMIAGCAGFAGCASQHGRVWWIPKMILTSKCWRGAGLTLPRPWHPRRIRRMRRMRLGRPTFERTSWICCWRSRSVVCQRALDSGKQAGDLKVGLCGTYFFFKQLYTWIEYDRIGYSNQFCQLIWASKPVKQVTILSMGLQSWANTGWWFGTFFIFPYIGNNYPNWRSHIFQRGGPTTNQYRTTWKISPRRVLTGTVGWVYLRYHSPNIFRLRLSELAEIQTMSLKHIKKTNIPQIINGCYKLFPPGFFIVFNHMISYVSSS